MVHTSLVFLFYFLSCFDSIFYANVTRKTIIAIFQLLHAFSKFVILCKGFLPIRWMALEYLEDYTCNTKTDV